MIEVKEEEQKRGKISRNVKEGTRGTGHWQKYEKRKRNEMRKKQQD